MTTPTTTTATTTATAAGKPTVTYGGTTYKVRSARTVVPDLASMDRIAVLVWLNRNTYARGRSTRPALPNLHGLTLVVR